MKAIKPEYIEDLDQEVFHCVECSSPYSKDESWMLYNGSTLENHEDCIECDKPRFDALGNCPRCEGLVFEFKNKFSCIEQTLGKCDFSLNKEYLDTMEIYPMRIMVGNMLVSPETVIVSEGARAWGNVTHIQEIAFDDPRGGTSKLLTSMKIPPMSKR